MATSVAKRAQTTQVNSLDARLDGIDRHCAKASIVVKSDEELPVPLFFEAVAECGMSEKEAAYTMAMDPAQLSRVKSGQARLTLDAMWRLPDHFWKTFDKKVSAAKGLSETSQRELDAARIGELVRLLVERVA